MSAKKPKVLQLIANLSVGGAEMHLLYLVQGLLDSGEFDVEVAYLRESPDEARPMVSDFRRLGVRLTDLEMTSLADGRAALKLNALLGHVRPSLVHTHLAHAHLLGIPLSRLKGLPVVSSVHNVERHFASPVKRPIYRLLLSSASRVIAISDAVHQALVGQVGIPEGRVRRVYYGFPVTGAPTNFPSDLNGHRKEGHGPLIATVGRLAEQKGQRYLIEAIERVRQEFPLATALIVGHDGGLRSALEDMILRARLEESVILTGFRNDVAGIVGGTDLFVLPSLWEGFGLVLLEAMAAGCPVVASNVASVKEIVVHDETGLLVPPADSAALSDAILHLLKDPEKAKRMGEAGRARVLKEFTIERMVEQTQSVYRDVVRV